jgi:TP901 family phage tail tape measure protein
MAIFLPIVSKFQDEGINKAVFSISKLGATAANAAAGGLAALGVATVASIKAFADFDAEMTKSLAIMGHVSDSLQDDMSDAAREVAKTTTFSANQAAEAYFFLASAGLDAAASIEAMPKVAKFAQAGMFDMALATDLLTDAQSALGLTIRDDAIKNMENLVRVSDVLVKANTLANASVEQFSTALTTKAGAALRALGKDVEEGVAVLAAFADQGIKGEIAGTQLSIVLRDLTTKAINNKSAFREMGIAVFDANGEMNNLGDIIGNLETALAGMSDETQKATLLQLGFSDKSLASLQALLGTSEAIKTYEGALREAAGTTDEVASKQLETLNAQLGLIKSAFVDLGIEIGERLEPTVTGLAEEVQLLLAEMVASPEFEAFIVELTVAMEELLPSLIELLPPLTELAIELVPLLIDLIPLLAWVTDFFRVIVEGLTGGIERLDEEINLFFGTADSGISVVDRIRGAFESFENAARALAERIREAWRAFKAFLDLTSGRGGNLNLNVPQLAEGGIVTRPTLAMIGEGGESEAVIPLSKMSQFGFGAGGGRGGAGSNITINVNAGMGTDGARVGEAVVKAIRQYERTSGRVFASA